MPIFYTPPANIGNETIILPIEETHHIKDVLRKITDDLIPVTDGEGNLYKIQIDNFTDKGIEGRIIERACHEVDRECEISIAQAVPKGTRMDFFVEKATELGVKEIIPIHTRRSSFPNDKNGRWQRIAVSAIKQSERLFLPRIEPLSSYEDVLNRVNDYDITIIAWERAKDRNLKGLLNQKQRILAFIGPEGGFTDEEIEKAQANGAIPITIGDTILRSETAGIALIAMILFEKDKL
jgi:16S rRNA (uracil1498-N3)-methyltransferase